MAGEKKSAIRLCNDESRVKVLSVQSGQDLKQFVIVPTQVVEVPAQFAEALVRNKDAVEILKTLRGADEESESFRKLACK